jgi:carbon-monoxide dehydrogenase large subunit
VGGGFGSKLDVYAEEALALALCRKLNRPVKWIETRSENYVATIHGRGVLHDCTLAGTEDGRILGMKFVELADMGAYFQLLTPGIPELGGWVYMGPFDISSYWYEYTGVMTNATPTDAYRGAGRPEATFVVERIVDTFARRIGMDPVELRRKNLHPPFSEATPNICGLSVDSANYEPALDRAVEMADYATFRAEQASRRANGDTKQLGIGVSTYIEMCGWLRRTSSARFATSPAGGTVPRSSAGRSARSSSERARRPRPGSRDRLGQIVADGLGVSPDDVEVLHGDTSQSRIGMDTYGSRSVAIGGEALRRAVEKVETRRGRSRHTSSRCPRTISTGPTARSRERRARQGHGRSQTWRHRRGMHTTYRPASSPCWREPPSSTHPTSRGRAARISASWKSIPPRARPTSCATWRSMTAATSSTR